MSGLIPNVSTGSLPRWSLKTFRTNGRLAAWWAVAFAILCPPSAPSLRAHGDVHEAIATFDKAIAESPDRASLYLQRGALHRVHRDWSAAWADFDTAEKLNPALTEVDLARGETLAEAGKTAEAKAALDRFIVREPRNPQGYAVRARLLVRTAEPAAASDDFAEAIRLSQEPGPDLFLERAEAMREAGRLAEAIRGLDEGMQRLGPLITLNQAALDLEERSGRVEAALARIDRALASSAGGDHWLIRKGRLLERLERPLEAREAYATAQRLLEALPPGRRHSAAMSERAVQVRDALRRLEAPGN
jgi:tetratricopeptide (TPR) repeat protein